MALDPVMYNSFVYSSLLVVHSHSRHIQYRGIIFNPFALIVVVAAVTAWFVGGAQLWAQHGPLVMLFVSKAIATVMGMVQNALAAGTGAGVVGTGIGAAAGAAPRDDKVKRE